MYKPYPKYKKSVVAWLGDVPDGWEVLKTKYCFRLIVEPAPKNNNYELLSIYTDIGVKPRKDLEAKGNKATTTDGYWIVQKGDLIVNKLLAWMGAIGYSHYNGVTSPAYDILRSNKNISSRFYSYLFRTKIAQQEFKRWSRGIMEMRLRLYFSEFGNILLPVPALDEQIKIVNYIEEKTKKIDTLIKKQQTLIELLKEKRQALISHVVTKGLDDSVVMKDSGVAWLGDVPEGWTIPKLSLLTSHIGDGLHGTPKYVENSMFSFINGNNLVNGKIQFKSTTKCVSEEEYIKYKKPLTFTTLLLSINGTIGNMAFYNHEKIMLGKSSAYINCTNKILREYLYYFLQSSSNKQYFTLELTGTTIFNLSLETIRNTPIPLPPLKDQQKIANHLDQKTKQIDTLIEKSTKAIELLKERRVALVSAVVTGKVDVRDYEK